MSEATKAALDAALAAHISDECDGGILTGYVLQTQYQDIDMMNNGDTGLLRIVAEHQSFIATVGLARYMNTRLDTMIAADETL